MPTTRSSSGRRDRASGSEERGQAEIHEPHPPARVHQHVLGLDVPVDDPGLVGVLEGLGDLRHEVEGIALGDRALGQELPQARPFHVFHHQAVEVARLADVEHRDDERVPQLRDLVSTGCAFAEPDHHSAVRSQRSSHAGNSSRRGDRRRRGGLRRGVPWQLPRQRDVRRLAAGWTASHAHARPRSARAASSSTVPRPAATGSAGPRPCSQARSWARTLSRRLRRRP